MSYLLSLEEQGRDFAFSLGFGFLIGILYDVVRPFRLLFAKTKYGTVIFDLLYMLLSAVCTFLFLLSQNGGQLQGYLLLGALLGFSIYFVTLGTVLAACFDSIFAGLQFCFQKGKNALHRLFRKIFQPLCRFFSKNSKKTEKKAHFSIRKSKFHLKCMGNLLYNLPNHKNTKRGRPSSLKRKRGKTDGKT